MGSIGQVEAGSVITNLINIFHQCLISVPCGDMTMSMHSKSLSWLQSLQSIINFCLESDIAMTILVTPLITVL